MNESEKKEYKGRLYLWDSAIVETKRLIELANRSKGAGQNQPNIKEEEEKYSKALRSFRESHPDHEPGAMKASIIFEFQKSYNFQFPTRAECHHIHDTCKLLAIVFFCQILTYGEKDKGKVASNPTNFDKKTGKVIKSSLLDSVCKHVFPLNEEKEKFEELCSKLLKARHEMLAHADGETFNVQHGEQVTSMSLHRKALDNIDFSFWMDALKLLDKGVSEEQRKMK